MGAEFAIIKPENSDTLTIEGLNPRVGYALRLGDGFSIWPRAGMSYVHVDVGEEDEHLLATSLELQLVITPLPHVAFMVGPQVGLQAGLIGWM